MPVRQTLFHKRLEQRRDHEVREKAPKHDELPPIDDQLTRLEDDIRRLKIEFEIYFNGGSKRPPYDTKGRVETQIKRLGDERSMSFAQRFRYNSFIARYVSFKDLWRRTIQGREEGKDVPGRPVAKNANLVQEEQRPVDTKFICADAHSEVPVVKELYQSVIEAKKVCGEETAHLSFPEFHKMIADKADLLKERLKCKNVVFSVSTEGGRLSFKVKPEES